MDVSLALNGEKHRSILSLFTQWKQMECNQKNCVSASDVSQKKKLFLEKKSGIFSPSKIHNGCTFCVVKTVVVAFGLHRETFDWWPFGRKCAGGERTVPSWPWEPRAGVAVMVLKLLVFAVLVVAAVVVVAARDYW